MHAVNHRLEHFGERAGRALRRLLIWLTAPIDLLAQRNADRRIGPADDILWDDGEPEEKR